VEEALGTNVVSIDTIKGVNHHIQQLNEVDPRSLISRYATAAVGLVAALERAQTEGVANLQICRSDDWASQLS
jgi:hypothetical protein